MKHFWPLTIVVVMFAFTAQAGQVNNKPTVSRTQTMQAPPTMTSATPRHTVTGQHFKKARIIIRAADPQSGLPTGRRLHKPVVATP